MDAKEIQFSVEALLFSSGRTMEEENLASILSVEVKEIRKALKKIQKEYAERNGSLTISQEGTLWKMLVRNAYLPVVQRVVADIELSRQTLETLAVVAYNYPKILQADVIHSRGSSAYEHIKELETAGFITRVPEGRSFAIKLTEKFFEYFEVEGADDIRAVFKDVKIPEIPLQTKLGNLDVVDVPKEEVLEEENPFMTRELGTKPQMSDEEKDAQEDFFSKLDKKIDEVSSRNDQHEKDISVSRLEESEFDSPKEDADSLQEEAGEEERSDDEDVDDSFEEPEPKKKSALDEPLDLEQI